ncbi:protein kinase, partial [Gemmatimonadota bacterium]
SVALKFLPPDLTRSAEARERFIHEAQTASALDHPNICTIHEIDETDEGQIYIVMGLYEGQILREKIAERPLKLEDAIEITSQISRGLASAHESRIIHRDIKPANIFITTNGEVRILDFGLAKLHGQTKLTLTGTTLGTVSYMSPEQARGEEADHRGDIWSLGVMMYEMLAGQQPFRGEHEQAVIYSILNEEPEPITALRTGIPLDLEWVVQKALRKNQKERYQHIDEIPVDLAAVERAKTAVSQASVTVPSRGRPQVSQQSIAKSLLKIGIPAAVIVLLAGFLLGRLPGRGSYPSATPSLSVGLTLPDLRLAAMGNRLSVSPDGKQLAVAADSFESELFQGQQIFIRTLGGTSEFRSVPDTRGVQGFAFSQDSEWIVFRDDNNKWLKKHSLVTQETYLLCESTDRITGLDWGTAGSIIYSCGTKGLFLVSEAGGAARKVSIRSPLDEDVDLRHPQFLPDGKTVLVTLFSPDPGKQGAGLLSLESGELRVLPLEGGGNFFRYISEIRHLVYMRGDLMVVRSFDPRRSRFDDQEISTGYAISVVGGSLTEGAQFSVSQNGLLVFEPALEVGYREEKLVEVSLDGTVRELQLEARDYGAPSLSPDGSQIAVAVRREKENIFDLWVMAVDGSNSSKTSVNVSGHPPVWHPDGERVAFASDRNGSWDVFQTLVDGSTPDSLLMSAESRCYPYSWAPDGHALVCVVWPSTSQADLRLIYDNGDTVTVASTSAEDFKATPEFSPDSRYLVYTGDKSQAGRALGIYVRSVPGSGSDGYWQIAEGSLEWGESRDAVYQPQWAPGGDGIYYKHSIGDRRYLMKVGIELTPTFRKTSDPELIIELSRGIGPDGLWVGYLDIHPVLGDRFLTTYYLQEPKASSVTIVTNWFEKIDRLRPPD